MKKQRTLTIITIFLVTILVFVQCYDAKNLIIDKALKEIAKGINEGCPVDIGNILRMDSCQAAESKTLKLFFTVAMLNADTFDSEIFERDTKPGVIYFIQTTESLKIVREYDAVFLLEYRDDKGKKLGEITVTPDEYNQPINESSKGGKIPESEDLYISINNEILSLQSRLPLTIEDGLALTDCQLNNETVEYTYKYTDEIIVEFDSISLKAEIINNIRPNKLVMNSLNAGIKYKFTYINKNDKKLFDIRINADDI